MQYKDLEKYKDGEVIATGITTNSPEGVFMTRAGGELRYVAVKGMANDWAVYVHWSYNSIEFIKQQGDKVTMREHVEKCVPIEDEKLWEAYRL